MLTVERFHFVVNLAAPENPRQKKEHHEIFWVSVTVEKTLSISKEFWETKTKKMKVWRGAKKA